MFFCGVFFCEGSFQCLFEFFGVDFYCVFFLYCILLLCFIFTTTIRELFILDIFCELFFQPLEHNYNIFVNRRANRNDQDKRIMLDLMHENKLKKIYIYIIILYIFCKKNILPSNICSH